MSRIFGESSKDKVSIIAANFFGIPEALASWVRQLNDETAKVAQEIFENKELRALFDVQKDMEPEDLRALYNMALALKRKERGNIDDTGC